MASDAIARSTRMIGMDAATKAMQCCEPVRHLGRELETGHTTYPQNDLQRDTRGYQTSGGPQCLHGWQNGWPVGPDNAASPR